MNKESENALQVLTGKRNFEEVPLEALQQLAAAHPYFAAAQLLLAQKMKETKHEELPKQLQKTALYFPDEQWLRYLLTDYKREAISATGTASKQPDLTVSHNKQTVAAKPVAGIEEPVAVTPSAGALENAKEEEHIENANLITFPAEQILKDIPATGNITDEPEEAPLDDEELQQQTGDFPISESSQKISSILSVQADEFHKPVTEQAELPVAAEPFHTIDYFASQGIRLDPRREDNTFDKKVHKFTDWLRQMKRINPQPVDLGTETEEEKHVANIADSSNYTKKVFTESMAEVLLKQGKHDKAIDIYQKLSLLNPDKSAYFVALIQNIK